MSTDPTPVNETPEPPAELSGRYADEIRLKWREFMCEHGENCAGIDAAFIVGGEVASSEVFGLRAERRTLWELLKDRVAGDLRRLGLAGGVVALLPRPRRRPLPGRPGLGLGLSPLLGEELAGTQGELVQEGRRAVDGEARTERPLRNM